MEDSGSWIWDDYNNNTILNTTNIDFNNNVCENVTNHWLYFIFTGYLLPLVSPRVRDWFKETINSIKNSEVGGKVVTLTEYGFDKIQDIENDSEMKEFIKRMVKSKRPGLLIQEKIYDKLTEEFSGKGGGKSWRYLNKIINNSHNIGTEFARP
tara:strand:- start:2523 stop:2981 length:459 start_codon:yes stop_codon:yes gene_type:complete